MDSLFTKKEKRRILRLLLVVGIIFFPLPTLWLGIAYLAISELARIGRRWWGDDPTTKKDSSS